MDDDFASLHPAFARIVCICAYNTDNKESFKMAGSLESDILLEFVDFVARCKFDSVVFGGHNVKAFDIPVTCMRMLKNKISVPKAMNFVGRKPWEIAIVDTMDIMKFGAGMAISLDAMCSVLDVESPKGGVVDASNLREAYKNNQVDDIVEYCSKDVRAWLRCYNKLKGFGVC